MSEVPKPGSSLLALTDQALQLERALMANAETNGGEINPELEAFLTEVETKLADKADGYKYLIDRFKYSSEMLWAQAQSFDRAGNSLDRASEALKDRIKQVMILKETDEVNGTNWRFRLSNSVPKLEIDLKILPPEFQIAEITYKPNRDAIHEALKAGKEVPGARVVPVKKLRSYVKKGD